MLSNLYLSLNLIIILLLLIFVNATQSITATSTPSSSSSSPIKLQAPPKLLVVSFDAFCPWYFERNQTSFMNKLRTENVQVDYMRNVFPTKTFVNHFSIATGLYPETHGVLGNSLYDLKLKKELKYSYELFHYNEEILPIWTVNEIAGRNSGCMMWPGSDFSYGNNISCTYHVSYDMNVPWNQKVDTVIDWLTKDENPANLVMLYFDEPDYHGHVFSPNSSEVLEMVTRVDNITRYIHETLTDTKLIDSINIVYVSDHGMDSLTSPNFINLTEVLSTLTINTTMPSNNNNYNTTINASNYYNIYSSSPVLQIVPTFKEDTMIIYDQLNKQSKLNGHFKVYTNEIMLPRWHCNNSDRMAPIIVVADINYAFEDMFKIIQYYKNKFNISLTTNHQYGLHGYDNLIESMHSFFFAVGPAFKKQHRIAHPFDSIDLYNLFTILLDIEKLTPPNNGTKSNIIDALLDYHDGSIVNFADVSTAKSYLVAAFTVPFVIIGVIVIGLIYLRRRRQSHRGSQYGTLFNSNLENI